MRTQSQQIPKSQLLINEKGQLCFIKDEKEYIFNKIRGDEDDKVFLGFKSQFVDSRLGW